MVAALDEMYFRLVVETVLFDVSLDFRVNAAFQEQFLACFAEPVFGQVAQNFGAVFAFENHFLPVRNLIVHNVLDKQ